MTLICHSLGNEEVIVHTLNDIRDKYKELATIIRALDSLMVFEELYNKLIDYEIYLKHKERITEPTITAQVSQKFKRKNNQSNKNFNKRLTKMPTRHMGNTQTSYPLLHHQPFNQGDNFINKQGGTSITINN